MNTQDILSIKAQNKTLTNIMSYLCKGCVKAWKKGQIMTTCEICVQHSNEGWTPQNMLAVYGNTLKAREEFKIDTKIYPPCKKRKVMLKIDIPDVLHWKSRAVWAYFGIGQLTEKEKEDLGEELWPLPCEEEQRQAFCKQELRAVDELWNTTSNEAWALLDPITQRVIVKMQYAKLN